MAGPHRRFGLVFVKMADYPNFLSEICAFLPIDFYPEKMYNIITERGKHNDKRNRRGILAYVAQNIIAPLCEDERPAKEVWLEMCGKTFNDLCTFVYQRVEK